MVLIDGSKRVPTALSESHCLETQGANGSDEKGNSGRFFKNRGRIFLRDIRRLNVALTRACSKLVIIGDSATVAREEIYKEFIDFVKVKGCYFQVEGSE